MGNNTGFNAEQFPVERDGIGKMLHGLQILHVADMLAYKRVVVSGQGKGILLFRAAAEDLPAGKFQEDGIRSVATGAPDNLGTLPGHHGNTIVIAGVNIPVVEQKVVGNAAKPA